MTTREAFRFSFPLRVRYAEVDYQGIVFNAHYLTYFDVAITEYFRRLGFRYEEMVKRTGNDFHLVKALVQYKAPIGGDEEIEVAVRVARIGRSSVNFELAIFAKAAPELRATGEIVYVNTDQTTREPVPVDDETIDLIASFEGDAMELALRAQNTHS